MTTIIYLRTSTTEQEPENQLKECLTISKYGQYEVLIDKQSAWKDNVERNNFNKLSKLIQYRKVKHLIVWDLDRLYRNRKKLIEFFQYCKIYGCQIHSVRQQWLEELNNIPAPFNEMMHSLMLQIMGWLAEEESSKKSQRIKLAVRSEDGTTRSYKGNKWGRKEVMSKVRDQVVALRQLGKTYSEICNEVYYWDKNNNKKFVSRGLVHKLLSLHLNTKQVVKDDIHDLGD
jgi:DNA invertase Pin-like site-specific DNA recombinase